MVGRGIFCGPPRAGTTSAGSDNRRPGFRGRYAVVASARGYGHPLGRRRRRQLLENVAQAAGLEGGHDPSRGRLAPLPLHPGFQQLGCVRGRSIHTYNLRDGPAEPAWPAPADAKCDRFALLCSKTVAQRHLSRPPNRIEHATARGPRHKAVRRPGPFTWEVRDRAFEQRQDGGKTDRARSPCLPCHPYHPYHPCRRPRPPAWPAASRACRPRCIRW